MQAVTSVRNTWDVPCQTTDPVQVRVTSAQGQARPYQQATLTLEFDPACADTVKCGAWG